MRDAVDAAYACMVDDFAQLGVTRSGVDALIDNWNAEGTVETDDSEALDAFMGEFGVSMADLA